MHKFISVIRYRSVSFVLTFIVLFSSLSYSQRRKVEQKLSYSKEHLGIRVNSPYNELTPVISANGKYLYFTMGIGHPKNLGDDRLQDIYVSTLQSNGVWGTPQNLGEPINSSGNDAVSGVSPDGKTLFIRNFSHNKTSGLCFARRQPDGTWKIDSITVQNFINISPLTSQCISSNGKYIILSLETPLGYGGLDLYVSTLIDKSTNTYSEPQNLGPVINTEKDEFGPFLALDGTTLYFSSRGRGGLGDADLFITKRLDDSWINWTFPDNMGADINTRGMDAYYSIPSAGDFAYFSSSVSGDNLDLFRIRLRDNQRPEPMIYINGDVTDRDGTPLKASITCVTLEANVEQASSETFAEDGKFSFVLPLKGRYRLLVRADGYVPFNGDLSLHYEPGFSETYIPVILDKIRTGQSFTPEDIYFDFNSAVLKHESYYSLDEQAAFLRSRPELLIEIEGHTDSIGNEEYNINLSTARAEAVRSYLISQGVDSNRISFAGYGASQPIAPNETEEGRRRNRRVVFRIIGIVEPNQTPIIREK